MQSSKTCKMLEVKFKTWKSVRVKTTLFWQEATCFFFWTDYMFFLIKKKHVCASFWVPTEKRRVNCFSIYRTGHKTFFLGKEWLVTTLLSTDTESVCLHHAYLGTLPTCIGWNLGNEWIFVSKKANYNEKLSTFVSPSPFSYIDNNLNYIN